MDEPRIVLDRAVVCDARRSTNLANMFLALLSGLSAWWRRRCGPAREHLHFVLYTRQGCHLCEAAWQDLQSARRQYHFILEEVDVDREPGLAARYGNQVPVVTVDGKVRFRGAVNEVLLERLLQDCRKRG